MKWFFKFLSWYIFMWIAIIPMGWYFIGYYNANFELVRNVSLLIQILIVLGVILSFNFRIFILKHLRFIFDLLEQIDKYIEKRRIRRFKSKDYVYIKKTMPNNVYKS